MYAGVHFPSANYDGLTLGKLVASKVYDRIQPKQAVVTQQRKLAAATAGAGKKAWKKAQQAGAVSAEADKKDGAAVTGRRMLSDWLRTAL